MEEKRYVHTRIDFNGNGSVTIRRTEGEEGKAVVYTDVPSIKDDLYTMEQLNPDVVSILTDEAEEDAGMIQAVLTETKDFNVSVMLIPTLGTCEFIRYSFE